MNSATYASRNFVRSAPIGSMIICRELEWLRFGRPIQQSHPAAVYSSCNGIAEKLHCPWEIDLNTHCVVQHLDPAGDLLPECRGDKLQRVVFPVVVEPAQENTELWP